MTGQELFSFIKSTKIGTGQAAIQATVADAFYDLPEKAYIIGEFAKAMKANFEKLGVWEYVEEKNDCDDFGLLCAALARVNHHLSTNRKTTVAFGYFDYYAENMDIFPVAHQANFYVTAENGQHMLRFFEPQRMEEITLNEGELASIWQYYI